jgi:hypothetical protein
MISVLYRSGTSSVFGGLVSLQKKLFLQYFLSEKVLGIDLNGTVDGFLESPSRK